MLEDLKKRLFYSNLSSEDKRKILELIKFKESHGIKGSLTLSEGKCPACGK